MPEMKVPEPTKLAQRRAADPTSSAWVSANAGSGKTYVLAQRVVRLMLEGTQPSRILCLTFTNAAAAEMANRVFGILANWTMAVPTDLEAQIKRMLERKPSANEMRRARQLFALALDAPGGLKIQTIHAFCESLLHQFPLEANVTGHFSILEDYTQVAMLEEARRAVLLVAQNTDSTLAEAYDQAMAFGSDDAIQKAIEELIDRRSSFSEWVADGIEEALDPIYQGLNLSKNLSEDQVYDEAYEILDTSIAFWQEVIDLAVATGAENNINQAASLRALIDEKTVRGKITRLRDFMFTQSGSPRKRLFYGKFVKDNPKVMARLGEVQKALEEALDHIRAWQMLRASKSIFIIAREVLLRYRSLKRARGFVDYNDMIAEAANLLSRSDIRQWVQYKLDRGIDHVLIDEAQDTSPRQWEIINAVIEDFHAGETAGKRNRTVFAVGDEKQSIFSFQGAEPGTFDLQRRKLHERIRGSGSKFYPEKLDLSFRSTKAILSAVDKVFSVEENARGLSSNQKKTIHETIRGNAYGEVLIWPLFVAKKLEKTTSWLPEKAMDDAVDPAQALADQIALDIVNSIGKPISGTGKQLKFGDILVLVRKRDRFVNILTKTFKERGISIAGVDRLKLTDHIATKDLLALANFVLMPENDLALAGVLKSPIFDLNEDELYCLANNRDGVGLFEHIRTMPEFENENLRVKLGVLVPQLEGYLAISKQVSVFEFFSKILSAEGGRRAFLGRLGAEVDEILDAFLEAAMEHDQSDRRGLEEFVAKLQTASPEVKRQIDTTRDEVRVITVHSAKGLEAPIVYLIDSCGSAFSGNHRSRVLNIRSKDEDPQFLWQPKNDQGIALTKAAIDQEIQNAEEEYRRLLYVAMTRAADRLVICGYKGSHTIRHLHWHNMVEDALEEGSERISFEGSDEDAMLWIAPGTSKVVDDSPAATSDGILNQASLPSWATEKSKVEKNIPKPLTPAGAYLAFGNMDETVHQAIDKTARSDDNAAQKGTLSHKLLQYLPDCPAVNRRTLSAEFLKQSGSQISAAEQSNIVEQVNSILEADDYSHLFSPDSKPEVSIAGTIKLGGVERTVVGQIDRLTIGTDQITILDYKSGVRIPGDTNQIPGSYVTQMALYRYVLSNVHPNKVIRCALLWTGAPKLMWIPDHMLQQALEQINKG